MMNSIQIVEDIKLNFPTIPSNYLHLVQERINNLVERFRLIRTTSGEKIIFDDEDYELLRNNTLFFDKQRKIVMTTKITNSCHGGIPIVKVILNLDGKKIIKHKDGNTLNLKRNNIEIISHQKASFGSKIPKNNTSGYKGVSWNKNAKKYSAHIKVEGKKKHLGYFGNIHDAALAYNNAACEYYGKEYAFLNKVSWNEKIK